MIIDVPQGTVADLEQNKKKETKQFTHNKYSAPPHIRS